MLLVPLEIRRLLIGHSQIMSSSDLQKVRSVDITMWGSFQGFCSQCCDWLDGTLTSILLIGLKLDISFERFNWALSKPCLVDHCLPQGFSSLSILSRMRWLWISFLVILTPSYFPGLFCHIFLLLFLSCPKVLNASSFGCLWLCKQNLPHRKYLIRFSLQTK